MWFDGADGAEGSQVLGDRRLHAPGADAVDDLDVLVAGEDGAADVAGHAIARVVDGQPVQVDGRRLGRVEPSDADRARRPAGAVV